MAAAYTVFNGDAEETAVLSAWDGTAELTATSSGVMPTGYKSYAQMINQDRFYVAHRCGSANYPELSMYAATQSVAWGAPALELSVARSSDGVWFGMHDADINRTSGTTGLPAASTMTWAQIQAYTINQFGRHEPYEPIKNILDAYASSHLFFVDPKVEVGRFAELVTILKGYPSWPEMVIKYYWNGFNVANLAHAAGFRTWGYYYDADAASISETHQYWDLLGMDYTATQASWDAATVTGKRVLGHICPTLAAANTAFSKGATAIMASGVQQIIPGPRVV